MKQLQGHLFTPELIQDFVHSISINMKKSQEQVCKDKDSFYSKFELEEKKTKFNQNNDKDSILLNKPANVDSREEEKKEEDFPLHEFKGLAFKEKSKESKMEEIPEEFDLVPLNAPRGEHQIQEAIQKDDDQR